MSAPAAGDENTIRNVQDFYGKHLKKTEDLKTNVCTAAPMKMPQFVRDALGNVHDEVAGRYYGCGLIRPEVLEDRFILDLGCGAGRDCYMLAQLVGEKGSVVGIDMTPELLEVANKYLEYHREKFGYTESNVKFVKGFIEQLTTAGLEPNSFDVIVSNCVVNLSPDKRAVLKEAYTVLKDGGELYFSDMYADRQLSDEIRKHKLLWGEGMSGALYWKDLHRLAAEIGFTCPRLVTCNIIEIQKEELKEAVQGAQYVAVTYRLFKLPKGTKCEAREATYEGDIRGAEKEFKFDMKYTFKVGDAKVVDGEAAAILQSTRFSEYFRVGESRPSHGQTPNSEESWTNPFDLVHSSDAIRI